MSLGCLAKGWVCPLWFKIVSTPHSQPCFNVCFILNRAKIFINLNNLLKTGDSDPKHILSQPNEAHRELYLYPWCLLAAVSQVLEHIVIF